MTDQKLRKLVMAALFAALTTVMTMVIRIPSPMSGYVNLGDCAVLLSAWILGPGLGCAAAGIGSMLADLLELAADLAGDTMFPLTWADSGYPEGGQVSVDELAFTVWHTPGHTPGSVCLLCGQYLFTGDTLFAGSIGRTDLPGGSTRQMEDSLRKLAGLPIPEGAQVLPGHGDLSTFGEELKHNWYIKSACKQD